MTGASSGVWLTCRLAALPLVGADSRDELFSSGYAPSIPISVEADFSRMPRKPPSAFEDAAGVEPLERFRIRNDWDAFLVMKIGDCGASPYVNVEPSADPSRFARSLPPM
jgi:hypothetical protein